MDNSVAIPHSQQNRLSSSIQLEKRDNMNVYVKTYTEGNWEATSDIVRKRAIREAEILRNLQRVRSFYHRLGVLNLVESDPDSSIIVTQEAPGRPLGDFLNEEYRSVYIKTATPVYLAGKWLRQWQKMDFPNINGVPIGKKSPLNLESYFRIRLATIKEYGYRRVSDSDHRSIIRALEILIEDAESQDKAHCWAHGDYGPGNVLWDGKILTAIDFATAELNVPLLDVTYFIHRMEMLKIYFPWKRWPLELWQRAFLRGYGRPDAEESPMYRALMMRHLLCRLQTYIRRPPKNLKQRIHNKWVRECVRRKLMQLVKKTFQE